MTITGIIKVVLFNLDEHQPFVVSIGDRIAQLICEVYVRPTIKHYLISGPIDDENGGRERRENGFGSTGLC